MVSRKLRIPPDAERDLVDGRDWYAGRSLIAAERLLDEVDAALDLILEAAERWPLHRLGTRRYVMSSYPYSIVYRAGRGSVDVYAVAHAKRRPTYWRDRDFS